MSIKSIFSLVPQWGYESDDIELRGTYNVEKCYQETIE